MAIETFRGTIRSENRRARFLLVFALGLALLCGSSAVAVAPPFVSDEELARAPTIVVAKWDKAPLVPHNLVKGNVCEKLEARTEIVVTRVVKGALKPGKYTILLGPFIGWESKDGGRVFSYTSTEMLGNVKEVKDENLWFLESRRSWDKSDKVVHPALDTYRGVQPRALEPYYLALGAAHPDKEVPKLLSSREETVVQRSLEYIAGGVLPWPYSPDFDFERPVTTHKPLIEQASAVEALLKRKEPELRRLAASVYAALTERQSVPLLRRLLHDDDAQVPHDRGRHPRAVPGRSFVGSHLRCGQGSRRAVLGLPVDRHPGQVER